jgi:flagellar basal-body rod protein FlgG
MIRALWNSRSGMQAMQDKIDGISNNISNSETDGYKKVDVSFSDLVYEQLERNGYPTNKNGVNQHLTGSGVKSTDWLREDKQGSLRATEVDTDLAVDGSGYFKVTQSDGTAAYTRDGVFNLDSTGKLVDSNGNRLEVQFTGDKNTLTKGKFKVNGDGTVVDNSTGNSVNIGKISLYQPIGQDSMLSVGNSLYTPKPGTQINQVTDATIRQGYVEASNVDMSSEMTDMIVTQRAFELNAKGLSSVDQMMGLINNLKGN